MSYRTVAATLVALSALSAVVLAIAVNIATGGTPPPLVTSCLRLAGRHSLWGDQRVIWICQLPF